MKYVFVTGLLPSSCVKYYRYKMLGMKRNECFDFNINHFLETAYFTSKQSKKSFSSIEKCTSKIKVPQFLYCHYIYICMYVSVFATAYIVCASKLKFELGSLYMIISKCIFLFFEILFYFGVVPLFSFFTIFYISRVWNSRSWQPIYQIKALI